MVFFNVKLLDSRKRHAGMTMLVKHPRLIVELPARQSTKEIERQHGMSRVLSISNKLMSLSGRMSITDESNQVVYDAKGEFALFSPTWRLTRGGKEIATIRKKIFSWSPTWIVNGELGEFMIRRRLFSWVRRYRVIGGPFDSVEMLGNIWDLRFKIVHRDQVIAHAKGRILTLRDKHNVEILWDDPPFELLTVIAMVTLHMDRKDKRNNQNDSFK